MRMHRKRKTGFADCGKQASHCPEGQEGPPGEPGIDGGKLCQTLTS